MSSLRLAGRSKVWGRGYTTVPLTVRVILDIKPGDVLEWYLSDTGSVVIFKAQNRYGAPSQ
jgi:bifunctional DNA-binding transcriptional regulator/antitoxin component of YhaV-PrlF toxin-antitoxin module